MNSLLLIKLHTRPIPLSIVKRNTENTEFLSFLAMTDFAELQNLKHCGFLQFGINQSVLVRVVSSKSEISRLIFEVTLQSGERLSSFNKNNRDKVK